MDSEGVSGAAACLAAVSGALAAAVFSAVGWVALVVVVCLAGA